MVTLYIAIGIPASGKSTYMKNLAKDVNAKVISMDDIRGEINGKVSDQSNPELIYGTFRHRIKNELASGNNVICDATNLTRKERKTIIRFVSEYTNNIIAYYFPIDLNVALERNQNKDRNHHTPDDWIRNAYKKLKPPKTKEGFNEIHIVT